MSPAAEAPAGMPANAGPTVGPLTEWQQKLEAGLLELQQCDSCARHVFYPRLVCPHCGGARLHGVAAGGEGTVYATTTVSRAGRSGRPLQRGRWSTDEGVRMMSRVDGIAPEQVAIGLRVGAFIGRLGEQAAVLFKPLPGRPAHPAPERHGRRAARAAG